MANISFKINEFYQQADPGRRTGIEIATIRIYPKAQKGRKSLAVGGQPTEPD